MAQHPQGDTRENLADYAHEAWSGWMKYMFSKCQRYYDVHGTFEKGGALIIPPELVERWTRQMNTPYGELPESEKESDRAEADKIMGVIQQRTGFTF